MTISVVVVDDQALVRRGFAMVLGHQPDIEVVAEAGNGLEAIDATREHRPDVVLMDIRMPEMDGLAATAAILEQADWPLKVIILTTFDPDEYVFRALQAGASGFVLKDIPPEDLAPAVRTVADGGALLDATITRRLIGRFAQTLATDTATSRRLDTLTDREREVLTQLASGCQQRRNLRDPLHRRRHRQDPRLQHPHQTRPPRPRPGSRLRLRKRPHHPRPPRHRPLSPKPGPATKRGSVRRLAQQSPSRTRPSGTPHSTQPRADCRISQVVDVVGAGVIHAEDMESKSQTHGEVPAIRGLATGSEAHGPSVAHWPRNWLAQTRPASPAQLVVPMAPSGVFLAVNAWLG